LPLAARFDARLNDVEVRHVHYRTDDFFYSGNLTKPIETSALARAG
jgi:hypothetical protein